MKRILLVCFCLIAFTLTSNAQNKNLGIGTATPNANAVLHVESPTNNQGFIMPRLTTAQRTAMSAILTASDDGLMLYDTDLKDVYIWNGTAWSAPQSGQMGLTYPYADTLAGGVGANLFNVTHIGPDSTNAISGYSTGTGSAGYFQLNNPASTKANAIYAKANTDSLGSAVYGENTGGFGVFGKSSGTSFGSSAVFGLHEGTGDAAGVFRINNPASTYSALYGETNGTGPGVFGYQMSASSTAAAGYFQVGNASLKASTGPAVFGAQLGMGRAGQFQITNPSNNNAALRAYTDGTGNAGFFTINNTSNSFAGIYTTTNGTGPAISAENTSASNAITGFFKNTQATNTYPAIQAETAGIGPGVRVLQSATSPGAGVDVIINNTSSTAEGLAVNQNGLASAGNFYINNASNTSNTIFTTTNGAGAALSAYSSGTGRVAFFDKNNAADGTVAVTVQTNTTSANGFESFHNGTGNAIFSRAFDGSAGYFENTNAANTSPVVNIQTNAAGSYGLQVIHNGSGGDAIYSSITSGVASAGNFNNSNPSNAASTVYAQTNASTGVAVGINNTAEGNALAIFGGGMKLSTHLVQTATITTRAAAYTTDSVPTNGPSYSFGFSLSEGETFYFYNASISSVSINSINIPSNSGKVLIVLDGVLRGL